MKNYYTVKYQQVNGKYHIELTLNGEFCGGGNTECSHFEDAYTFACQIARSKGGIVDRFIKGEA